MFWLAIFVLTLIHWGMLLYGASWVMWLENCFEAKIQGLSRPPYKYYKAQLRMVNIHRFSSFSIHTFPYKDYVIIALCGNIVAAALIPSFTRGMLTGYLSDFLLITGLLFTSFLTFFLLSFKDTYSFSRKHIQNLLFDRLLFLPVIFFIFIIIGYTTEETSLDGLVAYFHRMGNISIIAYTPLVIAACALLMLVWDMPDYKDMEGKDCFGGSDHGLMLYINDLQFMVWLSLIAVLIWPQSLADPSINGGDMLSWLRSLPFGLIAWIGKIIALCFILALFRSFLFLPSTAYRAGIAMILSFLAIIVHFSGLNGGE